MRLSSSYLPYVILIILATRFIRCEEAYGKEAVVLSQNFEMIDISKEIPQAAKSIAGLTKALLVGKYEVSRTAWYSSVQGIVSEKSSLTDQRLRKEFPYRVSCVYQAMVFCNRMSRELGLDEVYQFEFDVDGEWLIGYLNPQTVQNELREALDKSRSDPTWKVRTRINHPKVKVISSANGVRMLTTREWNALCEAGWHEEYDLDSKYANFVDIAYAKHHKFPLDLKGLGNDGFVDIAPVGSFEPSKLGLFDMHGNVQEICIDPTSSPGSDLQDWTFSCLGGAYDSLGIRIDNGKHEYGVWKPEEDIMLRDNATGFRICIPYLSHIAKIIEQKN